MGEAGGARLQANRIDIPIADQKPPGDSQRILGPHVHDTLGAAQSLGQCHGERIIGKVAKPRYAVTDDCGAETNGFDEGLVARMSVSVRENRRAPVDIDLVVGEVRIVSSDVPIHSACLTDSSRARERSRGVVVESCQSVHVRALVDVFPPRDGVLLGK